MSPRKKTPGPWQPGEGSIRFHEELARILEDRYEIGDLLEWWPGRSCEAPRPAHPCTSSGPLIRSEQALETLGLSLALAGAYGLQLEVDREAAALRPRAKAPLRRMIYALLRLDRPDEAIAVAERLVALDPDDRRSQIFREVARRYAARSRRPPPGALDPPLDIPPDALVNRLPLVER